MSILEGRKLRCRDDGAPKKLNGEMLLAGCNSRCHFRVLALSHPCMAYVVADKWQVSWASVKHPCAGVSCWSTESSPSCSVYDPVPCLCAWGSSGGWPLLFKCEIQMEIWASGFGLVQPYLLQTLGE